MEYQIFELNELLVNADPIAVRVGCEFSRWEAYTPEGQMPKGSWTLYELEIIEEGLDEPIPLTSLLEYLSLAARILIVEKFTKRMEEVWQNAYIERQIENHQWNKGVI